MNSTGRNLNISMYLYTERSFVITPIYYIVKCNNYENYEKKQNYYIFITEYFGIMTFTTFQLHL